MRFRKLWLGCAAAVVVALSAQGAAAACQQYGKVARFYSSVAGSSDFSYVYILPRTKSVATFGYYYLIEAEDANTLFAVSAASASHQTVRIVGAASSCPTSGTWRFGGKLESIFVFALY